MNLINQPLLHITDWSFVPYLFPHFFVFCEFQSFHSTQISFLRTVPYADNLLTPSFKKSHCFFRVPSFSCGITAQDNLIIIFLTELFPTEKKIGHHIIGNTDGTNTGNNNWHAVKLS